MPKSTISPNPSCILENITQTIDKAANNKKVVCNKSVQTIVLIPALKVYKKIKIKNNTANHHICELSKSNKTCKILMANNILKPAPND